jgi:hypothetical protein
MAGYINNTGKILGATVVAAAVTEAVTGQDTGVKRGCLTGLVVWFAWVCLVLYAIYYLIFG